MVDNIRHVFDAIKAGAYALVGSPMIYVIIVVLLALFIADEIRYRRTRHAPDPDCGFCSSANGKPITRVVRRWRWRGVIALETLNPVVPGHIVVVSRWHTRDAGEDPALTARVMRCAAELVGDMDAANIITSKGLAATQNYFHLHVHIVPRAEGDELSLPWTGQVVGGEISA